MIDSMNIQLPRPIYDRLEEVATRADRSIPETVDTLLTQVEELPSVEEEVNREMKALVSFPNEVLMMLAQNAMSTAYQKELAALNDKVQTGLELSTAERDRQTYLLDYYQNAVLRRTYCLAILQERGHNLDHLLTLPDERLAFPSSRSS